MICLPGESGASSGVVQDTGLATSRIEPTFRAEIETPEAHTGKATTAPEEASDESGEGESLWTRCLPPVAPQTDHLRKRFRSLKAAWLSDCEFMSSVTDMAMHSAYQQIIGMGPEVLPLIFEDLSEAPGHWFWALTAIIGENPVAEKHAGNIVKMTDVWLDWACKRGYL